MFLVQAFSFSSTLIDRYNAIYVTLDKIQIRRLVHPQKPNHMCNFCLTKKKMVWSVNLTQEKKFGHFVTHESFMEHILNLPIQIS